MIFGFALARRRRPPSKRKTEKRKKKWRETIVRAVHAIIRVVQVIVRAVHAIVRVVRLTQKNRYGKLLQKSDF